MLPHHVIEALQKHSECKSIRNMQGVPHPDAQPAAPRQQYPQHHFSSGHPRGRAQSSVFALCRAVGAGLQCHIHAEILGQVLPSNNGSLRASALNNSDLRIGRAQGWLQTTAGCGSQPVTLAGTGAHAAVKLTLATLRIDFCQCLTISKASLVSCHAGVHAFHQPASSVVLNYTRTAMRT